MRRSLILVLAVVAFALGFVSAASGVATCLLAPSCPGFPPLVAAFGGTVSPRKLPRNVYVPVTAGISGKVATNDGTHPPALREAIVDIDKDVKVNVKGYPVCRMQELTELSTRAALKACPDSVVGEGRADFEVAFPEQDALMPPNPLLVFNGGEKEGDLLPPNPVLVFNGGEKGGKVTLLIHAFVTVPAPTAIVATVTISRTGSGLHSVTKIPAVAEGSGSLLDFGFKIGKTYGYKGRKVGYFEAKCPDGVFKANVASAVFKNEAHTPGQQSAFNLKGTFAVPCTPKG
jgi:hypothetical protein